MPLTGPIRVLIVDDHPMFREAVVNALLVEDEFETVGQVADGYNAVRAARELKPDVIVMDLNLPVKSGVEAIREIIAENPEARILAITSATDGESVLSAVEAGALGYILKDASHEKFLIGLRQVSQGGHFLPEDVTQKLAISLRRQKSFLVNDEKTGYSLLSRREKEVLNGIRGGLSNKDIAEKLSLSESTVRVHLFNILAKLRLENRNQAIIFALRQADDQD